MNRVNGLFWVSMILVACAPRPDPSKIQRKDTTNQSNAINEEAASPNTQDASPAAEANPVAANPEVAAPAVTPAAPAAAAGSTLSTGTTAITFTPVRYAAAQYPAFVYAVWISDANNKYIKTVTGRAAVRMRYLDKWLAAAGVVLPTQPDGVAGASITYPATPAPLTVNWDMKDKAGAFVPQGNYNINFQFTSANNTGLSLVVPIVINPVGATKTDSTMTTGVTAVTIKHTP